MKYAISCCYIFPDGSVWFMDNLLCLCDLWKGCSYINAKVSVSSTEWRYGDVLKTSFLSIFFEILLHIIFFSILTIGKHIEENMKNNFYTCIKFVETCQKDAWKMPLSGVRIMAFYERPKKVILIHSIKIISTTFLKYSFSIPPERKNNWTYPTSQKL